MRLSYFVYTSIHQYINKLENFQLIYNENNSKSTKKIYFHLEYLFVVYFYSSSATCPMYWSSVHRLIESDLITFVAIL